ncbi:MAG: transcriptional regulator [Hyphomicrobiales bacterium]|nr:YafY family transcriptional regulator [Hyphomicrobiales bacterium]PCH50120.1 MAG: transcriptional regulator [Hyphomicrobiales bacterium]
MSRSIRLIQLMQQLRSSSPPIRAGDLAQELNVSVRSIYRDIDTLRASGAIIDGEAGFGYTLVEDPALPPMMFSRDEMEALVLGLREVGQVGDPVLAKAANDALHKIKACLPERMRLQFEHSILHAIRFHPRPKISIDIAKLRQAAWEEYEISINYTDAKDEETQRNLKPLSIIFMDQALMLLAWCNLREDFRSFRIDRIKTLSVTNVSFRPKRVSLLRDYWEIIKRNNCEDDEK